jgi:membrane protein YqaA with SNARE-associated domain
MEMVPPGNWLEVQWWFALAFLGGVGLFIGGTVLFGSGATRSLRFAAIATAGSVVGGIIGYGIGAGAWQLVEPWFFDYVPGVSQAAFDRVQALYDRWDIWAIFFAGLTPIPYKVFTLSAGVFSISLPVFLVASVLSRGLRFFVLAALIFKFGKPIESFIDRYFNVLATLFGVLLIAGFLVLEFLL